MVDYRKVKFLAFDIDDAFETATEMEQVFREEGVYVEHEIHFLKNGNYVILFKLINHEPDNKSN